MLQCVVNKTIEKTKNFIRKLINYQLPKGALDATNHPITKYIIEERLFYKRNEEGKTAFDLAAMIGHREFLKAILERIGEKLNENEFDIRVLLNPDVAYNFMVFLITILTNS